MSTRKTGKVVNWNDARGYGFLSVDGQKDDVFLHVSAFPEAAGRPENGLWLRALLKAATSAGACGLNRSG